MPQTLLANPAAQRFPKLAELLRYLDALDHRADLAILADLLGRLAVSRCDIDSTCVFGAKGYRRNSISRTDCYELLACCWRSADRTPIHDHRGVSCAFRVVEGEGTEIRFRPTPSGLVCPVAAVTMPPGYVCSAEDSDIHQVANMQPPGRDLITLHIYSPPITKMHTYDYGVASTSECGTCYENQGAAAGESELDMPC
jgi:cysteine dioxygenase